jgi:hypothetical protein
MSLLLLAPAAEPAASGPPWWVWVAIAGGVVGVGLLFLIVAAARKPKHDLICVKCKRVTMPDWQKCLFCGTPIGAPKAGELEFVSGPMIGKTVPLDRDVTTIGSVAGNTILLTDTGVSRKHAGIRRVEDGWELADLGSTNGVYVNGERVARRKLTPGDVIRVGTTEIVFRS